MSAAVSVGQRSALASLLAVLASIGGIAIAAPGAADSFVGDSSSSVTKSGVGPNFSKLKVTVNQTQHLGNQVVEVSWTGGTQTFPTTGSFSRDYLQIMQCWGDGAAPTQQNCEFGAYAYGGAGAGGGVYTGVGSVVSRDVGPPDPAQPTPQYVPFVPVSGPATTSFPSAYFDTSTTNEIPFARTAADGTGKAFVEMQNSALSPALGCGSPEADGSIRNCWLVVVPRDNHEVDGSSVGNNPLLSSPLSQTNWNNAISFRMNFDPVTVSCPLGVGERRLVGQESAAEAVSKWQPALCSSAGATFGFSQLSDNLSRKQTLQSDPWMAFVTQPVDPAAITDGRRITYAPVALSGVSIAFNIDKTPVAYRPPASALAVAGQRAESMTLSARLVAKLLTESYAAATPTSLGKNPLGLFADPEFRKLNPQFDGMYPSAPIDHIVVPEGLSDAYGEVWQWLETDPDAKAFLDGTPDPWNMVVNPAFKSQVGGLDHFPLMDGSCWPIAYGDVFAKCTGDHLPYAGDMHGGSRAAARGNTLVAGAPQQASGQHEMLALADTATAARYSLPVASLVNASGKAVLPDTAGLTAGMNAMQASAVNADVLAANPASTDPAAYPLTHLTYAATSPDLLTTDEANAYARLLTYVTGPGQNPGIAPGDLPPGYVPLPQKFVDQAWGAVKTILAGPVAQPAAADSSAAGGSSESSTSGNFAIEISGLAGSLEKALGIAAPGTAGAGAPAPATVAGGKPAGAAAPNATPTSFATPRDSAGAAQFGIVVALGLGILAGLAWLGLPMLARRGPPTT